MPTPMPEQAKALVVLDAQADKEKIAAEVDFIFCAVDMKKEDIRALEEAYAKLECPVVSNNSAHRWTPDVPMVIPEVNPEHLAVLEAQKARLGTRRGFIAVKSNCSIQSYAPRPAPSAALWPGAGASVHLPGHLRRRQDLCHLAGDGGQRDPLHRRRGGEVGAGAPEGLGHGGKRGDRQGPLPFHHRPVPAGAGV